MAGTTNHFAFATEDERSQLEFRERLVTAGFVVTPVKDRIYFKRIYLNDPDGHIVELATAGPGFTIDEDQTRLGTQLKLPPWLEQHRSQIERTLTPLNVPAWRKPK